MAVVVAENLLTRQDLDALPEDGLRHELIDGALLMTPAPGLRHQHMVYALHRALWDAAQGTELYVAGAPFDVVLGPNVVEPDLVVAPRSAFTERDLPVAPVLVVEVRSQSTAWVDEGRKRQLYEQVGVSHYWLVDPVAPSITVLDLVDGAFAREAHAHGDEPLEIREPFPLVLVPSRLAAG